MNLQQTLRQASYLATPSSSEKAMVELATKITLTRLNAALKRKYIKAKAICGGSFAKGTWLPGATDVDVFVTFSYHRYKNKSDVLADLLEPVIKDSFTIYKRLHGSRDYFRVQYSNHVFEIVPVLKIKKPKKALNITDISPLHVDWIKKRTKRTKLANQIRLAKQFFKASGVYGAESYIRGFSGHVTEILTIKCGSFVKLARASQKWAPKVYIDPEHHYFNQKTATRRLNKAKLLSPMLIIDPIQPERNAAAALDLAKYKKLVSSFKTLLTNPSPDLFKEKLVTIEELQTKAKNCKLVLLQASPQYDKKDIAGAKLLKQFEQITTQLKHNDFKIIKKGWQWKNLETNALFWFYLDKKLLPPTKKHHGPPPSSDKERVDGFIKKYGKLTRRDAKQLYVILKRKYREPAPLLNLLLRKEEFANIKIL